MKKFRSEKAKKFEQKLSKESGSDFYETIFSMDCYEFEEFVANIFRNLGYEASVTKKSNDQGVDIILRKGFISTAVQVKQYTDKVGNDSVQQVVAGMKFYDCDKAMVVTSSFFTKSAIELAAINKVELIDSESLISLMHN